MAQSQSAISNWLDRDFYERGAFLTSPNGESITFGKGGSFAMVEKFYNTSSPVFYLKDFFKSTYLAYIPEEFLSVPSEDVLSYLKKNPRPHTPFSSLSNDDDIYQKDFALLKNAFGQNLEKVVLVSRETYGSFEGDKTIKHLIARSVNFGTGLPYGFWDKQYGVIGSTPELLYSIQEGKLQTFALAGTAKEGQELDLLNSSKDRLEHNLVIKDIAEKLKPFTHDLVICETAIHSYKDIIHLKTDLNAKVQPLVDLTELTNTLSPTAALGGYSKNAALDFLKQTHYSSKYTGRYFGSAFGLIAPDIKQFIVSIRNVQWEGPHLYIESGGGVVPESHLEKELEEIHLKRNTIRKHYL